MPSILYTITLPSLPSRGAWIEMIVSLVNAEPSLSLPSRGAWIEMKSTRNLTIPSSSLPSRGAWIEICRLPPQW